MTDLHDFASSGIKLSPNVSLDRFVDATLDTNWTREVR